MFVLGKKLVLRRFVCDAPVRASVRQSKYPNEYFSCSHCTVKGTFKDIVCFEDFNCSPRTDYSFRNESDKKHHIGRTPLLSLPIDMVHCFPHDFMHLCCLGVTKRLLLYWTEGPRQTRLSADLQLRISRGLVNLASNFPSDFARKPRSLAELKFWKATEFRSFLLNTGFIVLRGIIPSRLYNHFLLFVVGMRILCDPINFSSNIDAADTLLHKFVEKCDELYGAQMLVSNVHGLLHLAEDCRRHGPLDAFSAFKFENEMQIIKRNLRGKYKSLQQISNRYSERAPVTPVEKPTQVFHHAHSSGPLVDFALGTPQYSAVNLNGIPLSVRKQDCCFLDKNMHCNKILNILKTPTVTFICRRYRNASCLFEKPVSSASIQIFTVSCLSDSLYTITQDQFYRKCCLFPYKNIEIAVPLFYGIDIQ